MSNTTLEIDGSLATIKRPKGSWTYQADVSVRADGEVWIEVIDALGTDETLTFAADEEALDKFEEAIAWARELQRKKRDQ